MVGERRVFDSVGELAQAVAGLALERLQAACGRGGRAALGLAGGATPLPAYAALVATGLAAPWDRVDVFFSDERSVPPEHPASNFGAVLRTLLSRLPEPGPRVHRVRGELAAADAATEYDAVLRRHAPRGLDLLILGVGADGHIAGIFPGQTEPPPPAPWAVPVRRPNGLEGVSMTLDFINRSAEVWVLFSGESKRAVARRLFAEDPPEWPVTLLRPAGALVWFLDRAAAADLAG